MLHQVALENFCGHFKRTYAKRVDVRPRDHRRTTSYTTEICSMRTFKICIYEWWSQTTETVLMVHDAFQSGVSLPIKSPPAFQRAGDNVVYTEAHIRLRGGENYHYCCNSACLNDLPE